MKFEARPEIVYLLTETARQLLDPKTEKTMPAVLEKLSKIFNTGFNECKNGGKPVVYQKD